ncbi:MAG: LmeA family phospholipid-binding protein [Chloroflexota bacterium]
MGALWRTYVGCATVVFTLQLLLAAALVLGTTSLADWRPPFLGAVTGSPPTATPTAPASAVPPLRPTAAATSRATAAATPRATAAQPGARYVVEIEEAELNALLSGQRLDVPIEKPRLALQPGRVVITGTLTQPLTTSLETWGRLAAVEGRLRLTLEGAKAGGLEVPKEILGPLEGTLNDALAQATRERDIHVEAVEVLAGRLRLTGRPRG